MLNGYYPRDHVDQNIELNNFYWNINDHPEDSSWELINFAKLWCHAEPKFKEMLKISAVRIKNEYGKKGERR